jgi:hypothetical protein
MAKKLLQLFMKNDPARAALWSAINAWVANRNEEPPVHQQEMVELVENAARNFGRRRSASCRKDEHDACADDKCECRCHYTRRKSRFRPLRGQGEEARKARLARGLCPTHGVVLDPGVRHLGEGRARGRPHEVLTQGLQVHDRGEQEGRHMTDCLVWLVIGLFIGATFGFVVAALMHAAKDKREGT